MRNQKGITLIALIITIIVLAILAAVSITALTGQNGVVKEALQTSEEKVIADEKESVTTSYMATAMKNHGFGTTVDALQAELDATVGVGKTEVIEKDGELIVKYIETGRSYVAGNVYTGEELGSGAGNGNPVVEKVYADPDEWTHIMESDNTVTLTQYKIAGATEVIVPNYLKTDDGEFPVKKVAGVAGDDYDLGSGTSVWSDIENDTSQSYYKIQKTIEKIVVSEGIEEINAAFLGTINLKEIELPNSLIKITDGAFFGCISLTNIIIPNNVIILGNGVFANCTSLSSIEIQDKITTIGDNAFYSCDSLTNIDLPNTLTSIGNIAFSYSGLANITIPNSVTTIGDHAFSGCNIIQVIIPDNITSIGDDMFEYCTQLTDVTLSKNLKVIPRYTFAFCDKLENITIPDGVTTIGDGAFLDSALKSIVIPKSVTSIGSSAFGRCNLTQIYYKGTQAEWNAISINSNQNSLLTSATKTYNYSN